jgi:hydroxyacylglutathione hydrolase
LKFALAVEPGNLQLVHYSKRCEELRAQSLPTLPSTIETERQVNPFLRTRESEVVQAARGHDAATVPDDVGVFATLRQWKNGFK